MIDSLRLVFGLLEGSHLSNLGLGRELPLNLEESLIEEAGIFLEESVWRGAVL